MEVNIAQPGKESNSMENSALLGILTAWRAGADGAGVDRTGSRPGLVCVFGLRSGLCGAFKGKNRRAAGGIGRLGPCSADTTPVPPRPARAGERGVGLPQLDGAVERGLKQPAVAGTHAVLLAFRGSYASARMFYAAERAAVGQQS